MKRPLYITQESQIKRDGNTITIVTPQDRYTLPLSMISQLWIFGKATIKDSARNFLLNNGVEIIYLNRNGKLIGILDNTKLKSHYKIRLSQYRAFEYERVKLAKFFVSKKIDEISKISDLPLIDYQKRLKSAQTLESIIGIEGAASVYLFAILREYLNSAGISFERRSYNPPKDEPNSLLSFIYTLHYGYLYSLLMAEGFDPYIGYLHHKRGSHAPLVSDMMEAFRVDLTIFVANLFIDEVITLEDFDTSFRLKTEAFKPILSSYTKEFIYSENIQKYTQDLISNLKELISCQ